MEDFYRELYNFDPIPFTLVSSVDHIALVTGALLNGYYISINGGNFKAGTGSLEEVGFGCYELYLGRSEQVFGALIISIPAMTDVTPFYDPVQFRVYCVPDTEVAPTAQNAPFIATFVMISSDDHVSPVDGLNPDVKISINGESFKQLNSVDNPVHEIGRGFYSILTPTYWEIPSSGFSAVEYKNNECIYVIKATDTTPDKPTDVAHEFFHVFLYQYPA